MAELFQCDKCKRTGTPNNKRGRLIVQELNPHDGHPHVSLYNRKAELCIDCLADVIQSFGGRQKQDMTQAQNIMREANEASGTTNPMLPEPRHDSV